MSCYYTCTQSTYILYDTQSTKLSDNFKHYIVNVSIHYRLVNIYSVVRTAQRKLDAQRYNTRNMQVRNLHPLLQVIDQIPVMHYQFINMGAHNNA